MQWIENFAFCNGLVLLFSLPVSTFYVYPSAATNCYPAMIFYVPFHCPGIWICTQKIFCRIGKYTSGNVLYNLSIPCLIHNTSEYKITTQKYIDDRTTPGFSLTVCIYSRALQHGIALELMVVGQKRGGVWSHWIILNSHVGFSNSFFI